MDAYIYKAAMFCEPCALAIRENLDHANPPRDDSERYPCGPYAGGGGEADAPQHCDQCGRFLRNALTDDGRGYVLDALRSKPHNETTRLWAELYGIEPAPDGWRVYLHLEDAAGRHRRTVRAERGTMARAFRAAAAKWRTGRPETVAFRGEEVATLRRHYEWARADLSGRTSVPCVTSTALHGGERYIVEIFRPRSAVAEIQTQAFRRADRMRTLLG